MRRWRQMLRDRAPVSRFRLSIILGGVFKPEKGKGQGELHWCRAPQDRIHRRHGARSMGRWRGIQRQVGAREGLEPIGWPRMTECPKDSMKTLLKTSGLLCLFLLIAALPSLLAVAQDEAGALVRQLPTNKSARPDVELERSIADLGAQALPALEKELRLGIRFKTLNRLFESAGSRRWAVVRVLSQIPGEDSTGLLCKVVV